MKSCVKWFQNQSLRFKMVVLLLAVVLILQVLNGLIFTSIVSKKFEENISESNLATVRQLAINLNQAMEDIVNEMVPIRDEILSQQFLTEGKEPLDNYITQSIIYQELFNQLISADKNYQFINSMLILGSDGQSYSYVLDEYLQLNGENHFQNILKDHRLTKQCQWGGILKDSYFFTQEKEEIISIIMPVYFYGEVKNLLVVNLKLDAVLRYLEELGGLEDTLLLQLSEKDAVFGGRREGQEFTKDEHKFLRNYQESKEMENVDGYVVMSSSLSINQWKLSMITPKSSISSSAKVLSQFIITIIITTGIILIICVSYIVFIVTKPIKKMIDTMEANRHTRKINHRFHPRYNDEVGVLATTYNQLMDEIQQLMSDIEREQIENRKTYLKMLQMQIKPHFLYNTLEAAKFLVEMGDPNGVEMLTTVGKFYKLSLSGIYDRVKIGEEVEHLTCYLQILKMRYHSKYDYNVEVDQGILDCEIIKFSLQPLVENAVYHGIKQQRNKGFIKILGYMEGGDVVLSIWDNGAGIEEQKLKEIQNRIEHSADIQVAEHIGVLNVHKRIRMQYGNPYGLKISSEAGEFTRVEVRLPGRKLTDTRS